jgi:hypothetical protein
VRVVALIGRAPDLALVRAGVAVGETVALTARGDEVARPLLAAARTAGAKRLVSVWDPALDTTDYLGIAYALAAAIRAIGEPAATATLILAGDRGRAVVGPAVAERLSLPLLGRAISVELREQKIVARRRGRDLVRTYAAAPPALVCLASDGDGVAPVGGDRRGERSEPKSLPRDSAEGDAGVDRSLDAIENWTLSRVGLSAAELSYRKRFAPRPALAPTPRPHRFDTVEALAARLRADGLLRGGRG